MASILTSTIPWHDGEKKMHTLLHVPLRDNPTVPNLSPGAALMLTQSPLLALGAIDGEGRPWSTIWGGETGFAHPTSKSSVEINTLVDRRYDPLVELLLDDSTDGRPAPTETSNNLISGLVIDLETRRRVKLHGRKIAGSLSTVDHERGIAQLSVHIDASLGNCPKYLNKKHIIPALPDPKLITDSSQLPPDAVDLLNRADTLFVSSAHGTTDMDTNIRGGPPGFVRLVSNEPSGAVFVYPEYSGNRLYQTLGNFQINPLAGYVFPDFETGNALYLTGKVQVLVGKDAADLLPRSNLAVKVTVAAARYVTKSLPFRGIAGEPSPYNPSVRYLTTEKANPAAQGDNDLSITATLVRKEILTPTICRFRFRLSGPAKIRTWTPGQYAIFSFHDELDMGYRHMFDDDPSSLNDDYIRAFTVSSYPGRELPASEFEITVRKHGNVTNYLFRTNERAGLEVPLNGFAGEFKLEEQRDRGIVPFIAGGIGITPVIAQLPGIDISRLRLLWSISAQDVGLVLDTFKRFPQLPHSTAVYFTGSDPKDADAIQQMEAVKSSGAQVEHRRMAAEDLDLSLADVWYFCGSPSLKSSVLNWLTGKQVVYEDFSF